MINGEKYKTAKERDVAWLDYCAKFEVCEGCPLLDRQDNGDGKCQFLWLELDAEEEKPMPCPFCEMNTVEFVHSKTGRVLSCSFCGYSTGDSCNTDAEAIAAHNRVCKAVAAYKEREVK